MSHTDDETYDDNSDLTTDEIEMFYHTANMLEIAIDVMSRFACPDHDSGILLARAAEAMLNGLVHANTTEEEFIVMQARYLGDDERKENHNGTETVQ